MDLALSPNREDKKVLIVAGESSADRYAGRLVRKVQERVAGERISFFGTGGDYMERAGVQLHAHIRDLAHIGPREALAHIRKYYETYRLLLRKVREERPTVAVLLDFPDFNLRLAKKMKRAGVRVIYYISPQLWAWRRGRIRIVRRYVDKMLVILPFEEQFYRDHGVQVEFVGHPLLEDFAPKRNRELFLHRLGLDPSLKTVALLPGSRRGEVEYILPTLLQSCRRILEKRPAQFVISAAPSIDPEHLNRIFHATLPDDTSGFRVTTEESRDILANSDFAFVKSGTSTLEAALVGTPFVMVYKISPASWMFGNILIRSEFKGLVNLIAGERIVPEYLQRDANPEVLSRAALEYLESDRMAEQMTERLAEIRKKLSIRCASEAAAAVVAGYLRDGKSL
jgi:lipid-A-disaccharide synthase